MNHSMTDSSTYSTMSTISTATIESEQVEKMKARKRVNRDNANRNIYGNEGFLLMMLYYSECEITLRKPQKEGKNQKMKVVYVNYQGTTLFDRRKLENQVHSMTIPQTDGLARIRRAIMDIQTDNVLLDILKGYFGYEFTENVMKKPEKEFMPERRTLESIFIQTLKQRNEIVEDGVTFYENVKALNVQNSNVFTLSRRLVEGNSYVPYYPVSTQTVEVNKYQENYQQVPSSSFIFFCF